MDPYFVRAHSPAHTWLLGHRRASTCPRTGTPAVSPTVPPRRLPRRGPVRLAAPGFHRLSTPVRGSGSRASEARAKRSLDAESGRATRGRLSRSERSERGPRRRRQQPAVGRRPSASTPDSHQPFSRPQPPGRHRFGPVDLSVTRLSRYRCVETHAPTPSDREVISESGRGPTGRGLWPCNGG